ncbi:MAG: GPR endopeptidase [Clostridia bacterium]
MARTLFNPINVRTDMAVEARDIVRGEEREIPGVHTVERELDGLTVTRVEIRTQDAAKLLHKPPGLYITVDVPRFKDRDADLRDRLTDTLAEELSPLLARPKGEHILVVGLGNWNATPDALGPRVVDRLLVTRHLGAVVPKDIRDRLRPVSAVAPGVLGTTGIETVDIVRGIVQETHPDMVVAIDALAARSPARLVASVQVADSGIHPGSGVGNRRHGLTPETLGVPVVAIGVPTVVQAGSIVNQALGLLVDALGDDPAFFAIVREMREPERRQLVEDVISPAMGDLMVTPKEIDVLVNDMADVVAESLNRALQPDLDRQEWA